MKPLALNTHDARLAAAIRAKSKDERAERLARLVEAQEDDVPTGVLAVDFRSLTQKERDRGQALEAAAGRVIRRNAR